jgi:hypothetical protein
MALVDVAQPAYALRGIRIPDPAPQGVARIGGIGDDASVAYGVRGVGDQSPLRVRGMDLEDLGHGFKRRRSYNLGVIRRTGYKRESSAT